MTKVLKKRTKKKYKDVDSMIQDRVDRTLLTMTNLIETLLQAKKLDAKFFAIQVKALGSPALETIINPLKNVEAKLAYYMENYDENLYLIANKNVQIVNFTFGDTWTEVRIECL